MKSSSTRTKSDMTKLIRLFDIANITMGQSPESSSYNAEGRGLPFFQGNVDFGEIHPYVRVFCDSPKKIANQDDILISVRAPIGAVNIADRKCCIGRGLASITPKSNTRTDFIYYFLKSKVKILQSQGTGSTFKAINKDILRNLNVPDLSLAEQKQIAERLDKVQELIVLQKEQLKKLDDLIKSRFIDLFGDPITNPKGWPTLILPKVAPKISRKVTITSLLVWLLNLDKVESNTGRVISKERIPLSQVGNSTYYFQNGDVLYSKLRPYLNKVVLVDEDGFCTSELLPLHPKPELCNATFLAYLLRHESVVTFLSNKVAGAKMPRVDMATLRNFPVILPSLSLQIQFADFVMKIEAQKGLLTTRLSHLETLYKSLMQEYFG